MHLNIATVLASLSAVELSMYARRSGYTDTKVVKVLDVNILEQTVMYTVEFDDPTGSFGDNEPVGKLYVSAEKSLIRVEF